MRIAETRLLTGLTLLACASLVVGVMVGSGSTGPGDLRDLLAGSADPSARDVLLRLRLPRVLAAFGTGACLAIAGVLMQALLRNPLADPYILGTSGGAGVAALLAMLAGAGSLAIDSAAFGGALLSTLLVFGLARGATDRSPGRLLLTGVVIAAGWSALISLLLAISPDASLRSILFWLMGDFSFAERPWGVLQLAGLATLAGIAMGRSLNLLTTGAQQAELLGLRVGPTRAAAYFLSALLTALAVTTAGTVGFVGLVVPHLVRLVSGVDHRSLVPASALAGGALLVVADTLARTVLAPRQLPVGAITAMVGVPMFLLLLSRDRRRSKD